MISFNGAARKRSPDAFVRAAASIGVETAAMTAIVQVESSGSGFDVHGRPKALFEPHRFYRELAGNPDLLVTAIADGLAYKNQGEQPYPSDSYPRIAEAMALDETAALRATSWGLPQILGSNCIAAGFDTPQAMVTAFADGEDAQIAAMASFLRSNGLVAPLRAKNWAAVAKGYNGKNYAAGHYDTKLRAAYDARAIGEKAIQSAPVIVPPTVTGAPVAQPSLVAPGPAQPFPEPILKLGSTGPAVTDLQRRLAAAGYYHATLDEQFGPRTEAAVIDFQRANHLTVDGKAGPKTITALLNA